MSAGEELLAAQLEREGIEFEREYRFIAMATGGIGKGCKERIKASGCRDWRADFALLDSFLLVEVEGGAWTNGRHTRGAGFAGDLVKYDAATRLGWTVYRCDPAMVKSGRALETIKLIIQQRASNEGDRLS